VFVHAHLAPLMLRLGVRESVRMYDSGQGDPMVEVRFPAEMTQQVTSAVELLCSRLTSGAFRN